MKRTSNYAAISTGLKTLQDRRVLVGWDETSHYPDATPVAYVAAIQEFGSPQNGIPPRPFMRPTIEAQRQSWTNTLQRGAARVLNGDMEAEQVLGQFGMLAAGNVRETIQSITEPKLSPKTVKRKGFEKPLVDSGLMLQTLTSKVE